MLNPTPFYAAALALLLETRLDVQIIGQVSSMESLLCEAAVTQPDIVIIGMELPGQPTRDRIVVLRCIAPRANVLLFGARPERANLTDDTIAFLCQADPPETILQTVQNLLANMPVREFNSFYSPFHPNSSPQMTMRFG